MTDSDLKERLALDSVWPGIILLICLFHFMKACGTQLKKVLASVGNEDPKAKAVIRKYLYDFLGKYVY